MIKYDVSKYPVLSAFLADNESLVKGIRGPFGSGKSVACCMNILKYAQEMPKCHDGIRRSRTLVIRNTYRELEDTTIKTWLQWVPEHIFGTFLRQSKTHFVKFGDVELEVLFRSMDTDDDVRKLLSLELTNIWVNEAREIPWVIIMNAQGRLGRYPRVNDVTEPYTSHIIMDTNSPDTDHWWYKFAEVETPEGFRFYTQPGGLDPNAENLDNLPKNYYTRMIHGADPDWVRVHVHNQYGFIISGKPVFPEYNDLIHSVDVLQPISGLRIVRGWDWGLTPACVLFQLDARGRMLVLDEIVASDMGVERFSDVVLKYCAQNYNKFRFWDIGDPAGAARSQTDEKSCFQIVNAMLYKYYGDNAENITPGRSEIPLRLESIKQHLNRMVDGGPGFLLARKCEMLRKGFLGGYHYRKIRAGSVDKFMDRPEKNRFSHPMDALMHAASVASGISLLDTKHILDDEEETDQTPVSKRGASRICGY